jgi:hypothetical protein
MVIKTIIRAGLGTVGGKKLPGRGTGGIKRGKMSAPRFAFFG